MATEYKLSYTGSQINERLGMVDELSERIKAIDDIEITLENKQDALSFDSTPTEGSENPITSGGVYEALQNIDVGSGGGEGGNVALTAGDLLEIKDGVIRSTLGDDTGEEIEVFTKFYDAQNLTFGYDEDGNVYTTDSEEYVVDTLPEIGTSLDVYFTPLGEDTPIRYNTTVVDFDGIPIACCNSTFSIGDEGVVFAAIDESLPAFMFIFIEDDEKYVGMYAVEDYTGSSVSVGTVHTESKYVTLPDNALRAGDFIEIKDGTISSTLGKTYTKNLGEVTFFDSDILELVDSEIDEEDPAWSAYYYQDIYRDTFLDKPENEDVPIDIEVKYYPPESDGFVILKGLYVYSYDSKDDCDNYGVYVNAKMGEDDVEVDNPDFPLIEIGASKYSDADEFEIYLMSYGQDITGARIVIDGERVVKTTVKLPMSALDVDKYEISGDPNKLVSSYAVSEALENIDVDVDLSNYATKQEVEKSKQLIKGICGGFSTHSNAIPTGRNSWIEGCAAPLTDIFTGSEGVSQMYLSVVKETVNKNTVTNAYINIICDDDTNRTNIANKTKINAYMYLIFADMPNETYLIESKGSSIGNTNIQFKFSFTSYNENRFPVDTEITSRNILQLTILSNNGSYSHAEGCETVASGTAAHAEGENTTASGSYSHAEGYGTTASGMRAHAEGENTVASGAYSHAEGYYTEASVSYSHAEGNQTVASNDYSHAEGHKTVASGECSHAEGYGTVASGAYSHAEGEYTTAIGNSSHAEGYYTEARSFYSHAEGNQTVASGSCSHAEGWRTIASGQHSHVQGACNIEDTDKKYAHIVGNGVDENHRSNAHTLDWDGNAWYAGSVEATAIILSSPNGTRFQITVDDSGTLSATQVTG